MSPAGADRADGFLDALLDSLAVGVIACDAEGRIVLMNRALREVHEIPEGAQPADYVRGLADVVLDLHGRPLVPAEMPLNRARSGEYVDDTEIVIAVPGRRRRTFAATARPITGADGHQRGAVAVTHEVTALRRAEQFRECHRRVGRALRTADTLPAAAPPALEAVGTTLGWPAAELFLVDATTGELRAVGHWSEWRDEPVDFFDHVPVKGLGVTGRVWQEGSPVWIPQLAEIAEHGTTFERARATVCVSHGINTVLAVPVQDGNEVLGVLTCYAGAAEQDEDLLTVLLEGIAAQIGAFVALRRAESLTRELARMQDDFVSLVGHELRTPLASISAHIGMLGEDSDLYDADSRTMIESMTRNVTELHGIVGSLLDLAGLESGHLPLSVHDVDLTALVTDSAAAARAEAVRRGLALDVGAAGEIVVAGDQRRLRQVTDHLLANAIKYSEPGGVVRVVLTCAGDVVELRVSDAGIGLPDGEHERVFDRFFRGSNVRHHGVPGSGLGLSVVRTIVRLHGGSIDLSRNRPRGTTVVVRIPRG
ncbi:sensor histidine kinase [Winogradskya humida]|uniref:histidine kinase n=1 Tax=Winogradskya humida TaxID=113566 RepID=A0ABQ3ZX26_9ACTN|nr:PAS domain-containing sensor histidine kinase [Actinoplanes humidus]GIE23103.1 hypothetical protein Ahu01nite_062050 [Actinoplanes humidus]